MTKAIQWLRELAGQRPLIHTVTMDVITVDKPTVFTTRWWLLHTAQVTALASGIDFHEIDIEDHADGAALVAQGNDGNLTVPTVIFRDGSALTNPSADQVGSRLAQLIHVPPTIVPQSVPVLLGLVGPFWMVGDYDIRRQTATGSPAGRTCCHSRRGLGQPGGAKGSTSGAQSDASDRP